MPYLSLSILVPIVAGLLVLLLPRVERTSLVRQLALAGAVLGLAVTIPLYTQFNTATGAM